MVMINFYQNGLKAEGHALYSDTNDVVCAGISSIIIGALNWIDVDQVETIKTDKEKGLIYLRLKYPLKDETKVMLDVVETQLKTIEKDFSNFLKLEKHKCKIK